MTGANTSTQSETSCPCWVAGASLRPVADLRRLVQLTSRPGTHDGSRCAVGRTRRDLTQGPGDVLRGEPVQAGGWLPLPRLERGLALRTRVSLPAPADDAWQGLGEAMTRSSLGVAPPSLPALSVAAVPSGANDPGSLVASVRTAGKLHKLQCAVSTLGDMGCVFENCRWWVLAWWAWRTRTGSRNWIGRVLPMR